MICCLTLMRLATWPRLAVRGVSLLSTLGLVKIYWSARHEVVLFTVPWWKPQRGQSSTVIVGAAGVLLWVLWFISAANGLPTPLGSPAFVLIFMVRNDARNDEVVGEVGDGHGFAGSHGPGLRPGRAARCRFRQTQLGSGARFQDRC